MIISQEIHQSDFGGLKFIPRWICTSLFITYDTHHVPNASWCCCGAARTSRYLLFFHEYNKNKSNLFFVSTWHLKKNVVTCLWRAVVISLKMIYVQLLQCVGWHFINFFKGCAFWELCPLLTLIHSGGSQTWDRNKKISCKWWINDGK